MKSAMYGRFPSRLYEAKGLLRIVIHLLIIYYENFIFLFICSSINFNIVKICCVMPNAGFYKLLHRKNDLTEAYASFKIIQTRGRSNLTNLFTYYVVKLKCDFKRPALQNAKKTYNNT